MIKIPAGGWRVEEEVRPGMTSRGENLKTRPKAHVDCVTSFSWKRNSEQLSALRCLLSGGMSSFLGMGQHRKLTPPWSSYLHPSRNIISWRHLFYVLWQLSFYVSLSLTLDVHSFSIAWDSSCFHACWDGLTRQSSLFTLRKALVWMMVSDKGALVLIQWKWKHLRQSRCRARAQATGILKRL